MPLPFIIGGIALAAGLVGAKKSVDAICTNSEANTINNQAQEIFDLHSKVLNEKRQETSKALEQLGKLKLEVWNERMGGFVQLFGRIRNVELTGGIATDFPVAMITPEELAQMKEISLRAAEVVGGGLAALGGGALAGVAAYGGTMMFAAASTGTAISSLAGVAATNATLAWLGGGSLAAGGFGMAGGMAVLGGIVAGPALLIGGWMLSAKAKEALAEARSNRAEARKAAEEMKNACIALNGIREVAEEFGNVIGRLLPAMDMSLAKLGQVLAVAGDDYRTYSNDQKRAVYMAVECAGLMKKLLETPLLSKDGAMRATLGYELEGCKKSVQRLEPGAGA